jgi:Flp pilus assembly protein TadG
MRRFLRDPKGSSAVEFALVVPVVAALTLGVINFCMGLYAQSMLSWAAHQGARYWAVQNSGWTVAQGTTNLTVTAAQAQTYAKSQYSGPTLGSLAFTATAPAASGTPTGNCQAQSATAAGGNGFVMDATGNFTFNWILASSSVTMKAESCYPLIQ